MRSGMGVGHGCKVRRGGGVAGYPSMHEPAQVKHVAGVVGRTHLGRGGPAALPNGVLGRHPAGSESAWRARTSAPKLPGRGRQTPNRSHAQVRSLPVRAQPARPTCFSSLARQLDRSLSHPSSPNRNSPRLEAGLAAFRIMEPRAEMIGYVGQTHRQTPGDTSDSDLARRSSPLGSIPSAKMSRSYLGGG
jgi:hypothetical protein